MLLLLLACAADPSSDKVGLLTPIDDPTGLDTAAPVDSADPGDTAVGDDSADPDDTAARPLWILLRDPVTADADGDGVWSPGEDLYVTVTLENVQSVDFMYYPGIVVSTDHRDIPDPGGNWFYGLFGGQSESLSVILHPAAGIPVGDTVHIAVDLSTMGCPETPEACLEPQRLELSRVVGE